jgi:hypothetical protein
MASGIDVGRERDALLGVERGEPLDQGRTDRGVRAAAQRESLGRRTAVDGIDHRLSHLDRIALHIERAGREGTAHLAGWRIFVDVHRRRTHQTTTKARFGGAGLGDRELNVERRDLLGHCLDEAFDPPLGSMVQAKIGIGDLAAL